MRKLLIIIYFIAASTAVTFGEGKIVLELDEESGEFRFPKGTTSINREEGAEDTYHVGCRLVDGKESLGIKNPIKEGVRLLEMSESLGSAKAAFKLATVKAEGKAGPSDKSAALKTAIESYLKNMQLCLKEVSSFDKDESRAEAGKSEPLFWRGLETYLSRFPSRESERRESTTFLLRSAKQGFSDAQLACGVMYLRGEIVPRNRLEAYKWLLLAQANTFTPPPNKFCFDQKEFASFLADLVEQQLTKDQIAEAEKAATEFKPQAEELKQETGK